VAFFLVALRFVLFFFTAIGSASRPPRGASGPLWSKSAQGSDIAPRHFRA
jgi:hypothetical protein